MGKPDGDIKCWRGWYHREDQLNENYSYSQHG